MALKRAHNRARASESIETSVEQQADQILRDLQAALGRVVAALPGRINKAIDLQRTLEIDAKLAWRLHKFIKASSALSASAMVPGLIPLRRFLAASERCGVSAKLTGAVTVAFERFEDFVATKAGDRTAFSAMIDRGDDNDGASSLHRKASFRASAHFLGVQTRAYLQTLIIHPSAGDPRDVDMAAITQKVGVQRLRSDARVVLAYIKNSHLPIDPSAPPAVPLSNADVLGTLIPKFCNNASAAAMLTKARGAFYELELASADSGGIGVDKASDWTFASVERGTGEKIAEGEPFQVNICVSTPVESFTVDVLFHKSIAQDFTTRVSNFICYVVGEMRSDGAHNEYSRVAIHETIVNMGQGRAALRHDEAPRNAEVCAHVAAKLGWDIEAFRVYRLTISHPVVGSGLQLIFQGRGNDTGGQGLAFSGSGE